MLHVAAGKSLKSSFPATGLILLLIGTAWIYWPGLDGGLILDDMPNLRVFLPLETGDKPWQHVLSEMGGGIRDRPVSMLSFFVNFLTTGSDIWHLKFTNLLIHLGCGVLVFCLSRCLLSQPLVGIAADSRKWLALWIAAMWLLVPLHVSTTLYAVQRMAQLPALFMLAGLLVFVMGRQRLDTKHPAGYWLIAIAFLLFWPLALFSKENGVIFPLLVFLVELFFFGSGQGEHHNHKKILPVLLLILIVPLLLVMVMLIMQPAWILGGYVHRDFTLYERILTQPRILFDYAANLLLIPGGSGMGLFHDDFIKSTGLLSPPATLISICAILIFVIAGLIKVGTRAGVVLFGPIFFLAAHLVESSILPLELYFEHRNYLPAFGVFFSLAAGAYYLFSVVRIKKLIILAMFSIVTGNAAFTTYRVDIWRSWDSILLSSELHHPDSLRVQRGLAIVYIFRAELDKALLHLEQADRLDDQRGDAGIALKYLIAHCYAKSAAPDSIYQRLENVRVFPDDYYIGSVILWFVDSVETGLCETIDVDRVINTLDGLFSNNQNQRTYMSNPESHVFMARLLAHRQKWQEAVWHLREALKLKPDSIVIKSLLGRFQAEIDRVL